MFERSYNDLRECINFIKLIDVTNSPEINSHAVDFLNIFALVAVGFTWLEFISISLNKIENKKDDFYFSKIQLGDFYLTTTLKLWYQLIKRIVMLLLLVILYLSISSASQKILYEHIKLIQHESIL